MAVRDAAGHLNRAVESVIAQDVTDVQVVIVDCSSSDRTMAISRSLAERDVRIDARTIESTDAALGLDAALELARGNRLMFMGQDDWLASHTLERLLESAERDRLDLALAALSIDARRPDGQCLSNLRRAGSPASRSAAEFRDRAGGLIEAGLLDTVRGKLLRHDLVDRLELRFSALQSEVAFLAAYLDAVERARAVDDARYHLTLPVGSGFSASKFACCERDHELLLDLADRWGMSEGSDFVMSVHRRHLSELIACIENACLGRRLLSSIERNARIRDMLEQRSTCETIAALRPSRSRDFGVMYRAIARRNVAACCMGARLVGFMRASGLPLTPMLRDAGIPWQSLCGATGLGPRPIDPARVG